jgi:polyvinyl alcohol dehydrogenase (cytochrome)
MPANIQLISFISMLLYAFFSPTSLYGATGQPTELDHQSITIWSEGVRLAGDIYKPANLQPGDKLPGLLLVHGWGGTKAHLNRAYAPHFARLGFVVVTFDFKGWGESNGPLLYREPLPEQDDLSTVNIAVDHVRQVINPRSMVEDARAALNYLAGEKQVLSDNIGVWGTSLGGGIALVIAAEDDRIKAYVDQIGAVNFNANLKMITPEMVRKWEVQRARGDITSYPGPESIINPALEGYPDWIYLKGFDSFAAVDNLQVPTLIIDAEDEELFARENNGQLLHDSIKERLVSKYVVYPGKHYDIYRDASYQGALRDAQDWFVTHLKGGELALGLYVAHCAACHSSAAGKAPGLGALRNLGYETLLDQMTNGNMQVQAAAMNDGQREELARYLSSESKDPRAWESAMACNAGLTGDADAAPSVTSWGYGPNNQRHQTQELAGLSAQDLPNLELAWAQGFPGASTMRSQPVITADSLYIGVAATSSVYAFDLASGCLKWTYRSAGPVRSALGYSRMPGTDHPILFFGDARANVHVISALDGRELWSTSVKLGSATTITGTPVLNQNTLYVPLSSFEVARASMSTYECCKDHGGVRALDISTGETLWTYATAEQASATGKNSIGTQTWGPSGAPVWTTPAIDVKRNRLYIGTGENYSWPATDTSDAIIALDLDSGKPVWVFQALANDVYTEACVASFLGYPEHPSCPENPGPDFDFGASVIITQTRDGKDILLAGQKSGDVYGLDPDNGGSVVWQTKLSDGTPVGGVHWGMSVENQTLFVPVSDPEWDIRKWDYSPKPGVTALDVTTGAIEWQHRAERGCELDKSKIDPRSGRHEEDWPSCHFAYGYSGAATSIDGAVLAGSLNGTLKAFSSSDGSELWQFDSKRPFTTLNGVTAHGGALDNAGPVIGSGYLVLQSGYSYFNQMPGNVLLVFRKKNQQ